MTFFLLQQLVFIAEQVPSPHTTRTLVSHLDFPPLICFGRKSKVIEGAHEYVTSLTPDVAISLCPDCNHFFHTVAPPLITSVKLEFICLNLFEVCILTPINLPSIFMPKCIQIQECSVPFIFPPNLSPRSPFDFFWLWNRSISSQYSPHCSSLNPELEIAFPLFLTESSRSVHTRHSALQDSKHTQN